MIIVKFIETNEEKAMVTAICAQVASAGPEETITVTEDIPVGEYRINVTPSNDGLQIEVVPA